MQLEVFSMYDDGQLAELVLSLTRDDLDDLASMLDSRTISDASIDIDALGGKIKVVAVES